MRITQLGMLASIGLISAIALASPNDSFSWERISPYIVRTTTLGSEVGMLPEVTLNCPSGIEISLQISSKGEIWRYATYSEAFTIDGAVIVGRTAETLLAELRSFERSSELGGIIDDEYRFLLVSDSNGRISSVLFRESNVLQEYCFSESANG